LTTPFNFVIICVIGEIMDIDIAYLMILIGGVCLAYEIGQRKGIGDTLDYMKAQGHIDFDE